MTIHRVPSIRRRARGAALPLVSIAAVIALAGCSGSAPGASPAGSTGAASPATSSAPTIGTGAAEPAQPAIGQVIGAPAGVTGGGSNGASGSSTGTAGAAIAYPYPYFGGSPGLAPDHTIVVTGSAQAPIKADLSDRTNAERTALTRALADARAQADAIAAATGVTISGVVSVSSSIGQGWIGVEPMAGAPETAPGGTPGTIAPAPSRILPQALQLSVSVTVQYKIG